MRRYRFRQTALADGSIRLEWRRLFARRDPLDFWIVPAAEIEQAKSRVRAGEFE